MIHLETKEDIISYFHVWKEKVALLIADLRDESETQTEYDAFDICLNLVKHNPYEVKVMVDDD